VLYMIMYITKLEYELSPYTSRTGRDEDSLLLMDLSNTRTDDRIDTLLFPNRIGL